MSRPVEAVSHGARRLPDVKPQIAGSWVGDLAYHVRVVGSWTYLQPRVGGDRVKYKSTAGGEGFGDKAAMWDTTRVGN